MTAVNPAARLQEIHMGGVADKARPRLEGDDHQRRADGLGHAEPAEQHECQHHEGLLLHETGDHAHLTPSAPMSCGVLGVHSSPGAWPLAPPQHGGPGQHHEGEQHQ